MTRQLHAKRLDQFIQRATKLGLGKQSHVQFDYERLDASTLENLYAGEGLSARIVDQLPNDATREGVDVDTGGVVSEDDMIKIFDDYRILPTIADNGRWSRLFGTSFIYPAVNDGCTSDKPVNMQNITGIINFTVIPSNMVHVRSYANGLSDRNFLRATSYDFRHTTLNKPVSARRVYRMDETRLPPSITNAQRFSPSILDRVWSALAQYGAAQGYTAEIMHTASMLILKLGDYRAELDREGGEDDMQDLLANMFESASVLNMLVMDGQDDIGELKRSMADLANVLDQFKDPIVAGQDLPREVLFHDIPGGMNSGEAAGAFRAWYDYVKTRQVQDYTPMLRWMLDIVFAYRRNKGLTAPEPGEYTVTWRPLWQETASEKATTGKLQAETDQIHINSGTRTADELRERDGFVVAEQLDPGDGSAPAAADVATQAFNGAQVTAILEIVNNVSQGLIDPVAAQEMIAIAFPSASPQRVERMLAAATPAEPTEAEVAAEPQSVMPGDLVSAQDFAKTYGEGTKHQAVVRAARRHQLTEYKLGQVVHYSRADLERILGNES